MNHIKESSDFKCGTVIWCHPCQQVSWWNSALLDLSWSCLVIQKRLRETTALELCVMSFIKWDFMAEQLRTSLKPLWTMLSIPLNGVKHIGLGWVGVWCLQVNWNGVTKSSCRCYGQMSTYIWPYCVHKGTYHSHYFHYLQ